MKKKLNKKLIFILIGVLLVIILGIAILINNARSKKEITLSERKWIEENKKKIIDIYIFNR